MANKPLIQFLSETSNFCCQWAFLTQAKFRRMTNSELAKKLGVSERTVSDARSQLNNGGFSCRKKPGCLEKKNGNKG